MSLFKHFFKSLGTLLARLMHWIEQGQAKAPTCKTWGVPAGRPGGAGKDRTR